MAGLQWSQCAVVALLWLHMFLVLWQCLSSCTTPVARRLASLPCPPAPSRWMRSQMRLRQERRPRQATRLSEGELECFPPPYSSAAERRTSRSHSPGKLGRERCITDKQPRLELVPLFFSDGHHAHKQARNKAPGIVLSSALSLLWRLI